MMVQPASEAKSGALRLDFDRSLKLEFHGSNVTSDAGLLAYRELDDALGLMVIVEQHLVDGRTGRNGRHDLLDAASVRVRSSCRIRGRQRRRPAGA
jgi:hypothetical protein